MPECVSVTDVKLNKNLRRVTILIGRAYVEKNVARSTYGRYRAMTEANPHYINERQSDLRAVKEGWYAADDHGNLLLGPFSTRENCLAKISQSAKGTAPFESASQAHTRSQ